MAERSLPGRGPQRAGAGTEPIAVALLGGTRGLWTEAVAWMLTSDGYELVAAFDAVEDLMAELGTVNAELLLIDLDDRPVDWAAIGRVRKQRPDLKLVLITAALTSGAAEAIRADHLDGVIDKTDSADQARATLLHVHEGRRVFPVGLAGRGATAAPGRRRAERARVRDPRARRLGPAQHRDRQGADDLPQHRQVPPEGRVRPAGGPKPRRGGSGVRPNAPRRVGESAAKCGLPGRYLPITTG